MDYLYGAIYVNLSGLDISVTANCLYTKIVQNSSQESNYLNPSYLLSYCNRKRYPREIKVA